LACGRRRTIGVVVVPADIQKHPITGYCRAP
jgi:hypothetical protein